MSALRIFVYFVTLAVCFSSVAIAQDIFNKQTIQKQLTIQKNEIELIEPILAEGRVNEEIMLDLRQKLRTSRAELQKIITIIKPVFDDVHADLADLGPLPTTIEGETAIAEPQNIQKQRAALNEKSLMTEGLLKQAEALTSKSVRLLEKVAFLRRGQFLNRLFETQTSPFNTKLWPSAIEAYIAQFAGYKLSLNDKTTSGILGMVLAGSFFLILFFVSSSWSGRSLSKKLKNSGYPSLFSLVSSSLIIPSFAAAIGLFVIYQTLDAQNIINDTNVFLAHQTFVLTGFVMFVYLSTNRFAKAQIIRANTRWLIILTMLLFSVDNLFLESGKIMGMPLELAIAHSYIVTSIFAVFLGFCSFFIVKTSEAQSHYFFPRQIFIVLLAVGLFIIAVNVFGYAALSRYIFERLILLFSIFAFFLIVRAIIRPYLYHIGRILTQGNAVQEGAEKEEHLVFFWLSLTLDTVLFFIALPMLARVAGAEWLDIQDWASQAFFGFQIGTMTISIANIGVAILVFLALLFLTRLAQRVMRQKILPKTKMNEAIRQSITQVMGYIGLIVALMTGISAIGFDLTNLALIAGALSVGIGFGLQSIVSNFFSGLILLFERPIKVGDWIITASGEGIVKKISVRATEIETFDRTSIIVPNAELISSSVKNWTHTDKIGRAIIPVGVSYDSDPQAVQAILLKCAIDNAFSLKTPEPNVIFKDFADSALLFEMRFFIKNISDVYKASTAMRFEIWNAFKEANIEISFPQRDLHIRSADGLKGLIGGK